MVQIYEQVVSDGENKDTHCIFFSHWLQHSNYFTYIYSRRVLINILADKIRKIKMEPFLKQ